VVDDPERGCAGDLPNEFFSLRRTGVNMKRPDLQEEVAALKVRKLGQ
jgi:hypothetical protein